MDVSQADDQERKLPVPVEVEIYINTDGSVTFADLEEKTVLIAQSLNPEQLPTYRLLGSTTNRLALEGE
jgi:hypothetical protein